MASPLSGRFAFLGSCFKAGLVLALAVCVIAQPAFAATKKRSSAQQPNNKYAAIVIDADTGAVLSESGADKPLYPASLVKTMTILMTFEAIKNGNLTLNDRAPISRHAASMVPSKLNLPVGSSIRVEDAIYALVTKSANDVAVALAEKIGGTEAQFAAMMTRRAQQLGMTRTNFVNASGLHNTRQVSTARDQARLARYIIVAHPDFYHYFSARQFAYNGVVHRNHNHLMSTYEGMDGFKTGFIQPSGFNLIASAVRGDKRLIGVVFGGRTAASRNAQMASLLDRGFARVGSSSTLVASAAANGKKVPRPGHKPAEVVQMAAALNNIPTSSGTAEDIRNARAEALSGQGDSDPAAAKRYQTGLIAIAAVREKARAVERETIAPATRRNDGAQMIPASYDAPDPASSWAVQIGAFNSRVQTDRALRQAVSRLPADLASVSSPAIAPLKTREGWVFRGRLTNLSRQDAVRACRHISDCLPIAPAQ